MGYILIGKSAVNAQSESGSGGEGGAAAVAVDPPCVGSRALSERSSERVSLSRWSAKRALRTVRHHLGKMRACVSKACVLS